MKKAFLFLSLLLPPTIIFCSRSVSLQSQNAQDVEYAVIAENDPAARLAAVAVLKEQGEIGIPGLTAAAHDPDDGVRKAAIRSLGEVGGQEAADALAELLDDPDRTVRMRAIIALGLAGRPGFPYLLKVLDTEPFPRGRMFAASALNRVVQPGDAPAIMERFDRQDVTTQMHLVTALVHIGDDGAYQALEVLAEHPNRLIRFYVVNTLADTHQDERALPIFINSLEDEAVEVRMWAIFGLERLNHPASFPAVLAALGDQDPYVRKEAAYTLGLLKNPEAIPFLIESLKDPITVVRGDAATALGMIGDSSATSTLRPLLNDSSPVVQIKTAEALARLGDYSGIDLVIELVDSPVRIHSYEAARVLRELSGEDFGYNKASWRTWWICNRDVLADGARQSAPAE
ncbi:MAG: HEAT repeat domain-containing protein [Candidatus Abyssobacteria bacterium SURF_5]|uniref:HEAT repeat domain-containing protein n=1 Tax=Abyssobacteria bacterium (strain SURF_5) TaxID=2093360 RepID=A0A3A4N624_ABYX5|nr:MAG: HEAT repeat domain-containing protein [Candidatus Abyssubacteria bacterium SURF_5]